MPVVALLPGNIQICQYYRDHHPPHFHARWGPDEAQIAIAEPLPIIAGRLDRAILQRVHGWARLRRKELALNWVDALADARIQRIY